MIDEKRVDVKVKGKVYKSILRPAMFFGLEMVALTKRKEPELSMADLKMLRLSIVRQGRTGLGTIASEDRNLYLRCHLPVCVPH